MNVHTSKASIVMLPNPEENQGPHEIIFRDHNAKEIGTMFLDWDEYSESWRYGGLQGEREASNENNVAELARALLLMADAQSLDGEEPVLNIWDRSTNWRKLKIDQLWIEDVGSVHMDLSTENYFETAPVPPVRKAVPKWALENIITLYWSSEHEDFAKAGIPADEHIVHSLRAIRDYLEQEERETTED